MAAKQIDALWAGLNDPDTGQSYSGAIVGFFAAGTTTPKAVWYDADKTLPTSAGVTQVTLSSNGIFECYGDGSYKINIYDTDDTGLVTPLAGSVDGVIYGASTEIVDTIQDLRDLGGSYPSSTLATVLGYLAAGDGGGGPQRVFSTGQPPATYIDNGGSIIVPTGGDGSEAWLWAWDGPVNVLWGGVVAGSTDSTASMQALIDTFDRELLYFPYNASGYKIDKLTRTTGGSCNIDFGGNTITPFTADAIFIQFISTTFDEIIFKNLNADGYERTIDVQSTNSIEKFIVTGCTINDSGMPIRNLTDDAGYTKISDNVITNTVSYVDGEVLAAISVGRDIDTAGVSYIDNNEIRSVQYTFAAPTGIDVHAINILCEDSFINNNYINSVISTAPLGQTGCEAIYTKALTMKVTNNTIIDGGQQEAAITIKGASTSDQMSIVADNVIMYSDAYAEFQNGIRTFRDNILIANNYISNVTGVAIVTGVSNTGDSGVRIVGNTIKSPRGNYGIQCSHDGVVCEGNSIIKPKVSTGEWGAVLIRDFAAEAIDMHVMISDTTILIDDDLTTTTDSGLFVVNGANDVKSVNIRGVTYNDIRTSTPTRVFMTKCSNFSANTRLDWNDFNKFTYIDATTGAELFDCHGNTPHWTTQPTVGTYEKGERGYFRTPEPVEGPGYLGWVCTVAGVAGSTAEFENFGANGFRMGNTAGRPTLGADDGGYSYWDTTLGRMIFWDGTDWYDVDGTGPV